MTRRRDPFFSLFSLASAFLCQCSLFMLAVADSNDIFPLKPGLRCAYQYNRTYYHWFYSNTTQAADSGTIEYDVLDSISVGESAIAWQVREVWRLSHRVSGYPSFDTTYSTEDSSRFLLREFIVGNHELRSEGLVWGFPLIFHIGDSIPVYRYADSSHLRLSRPLSYCMILPPIPLLANTALFMVDSGLTRVERLICTGNDEIGEFELEIASLVNRTLTRVSGQDLMPIGLKLMSNFPNPFNPRTTIMYDLPTISDVVLSVHDVLGNLVTQWMQGRQGPGRHTVVFDGSNVASGMYFVRLNAYGKTYTNKMILLK